MPATRSPTGQYVRTRSPARRRASASSSPSPRSTCSSRSRSSPPARGSPRSRGRPSAGCARPPRRAPSGRASSSRRVSCSKLRSQSALTSNTGGHQPCWRASTTSWSQYAPLTSRTTSGGARAGAGPLEDPVEQLGRVAQVRLEHEPGRRAVGELGLVEHVEDQPEGLARVERLRVDVQVHAAVAGCAQQRAQAAGGVAHADLGRLRAHQRGQRRDLHRQVRARQRARASRPRAAAARAASRRPSASRRSRRRSARRSGRPRRRVTVASPSRSTDDGDAVLPQVAQHARARPCGDAPTMKRCAMCRTPAAVAAPSAARPRATALIRIADGERRRPLVHLVEEAGEVARPGRRASGRRASRRRAGTAPP